MTIGKARQSTVFFGTGRKPIGLHGLQHLSEYMACLGSPRVISTRLLQRCRAISWPPAAKLGGAPSWRLQFHRDPAKARDEQKRKGLNTHKQTKQLFFLGKSLYFMIETKFEQKEVSTNRKLRVFSTWNRGIYQESWSTHETFGETRKKPGLAHTFYKFRVDDEMSRKNCLVCGSANCRKHFWKKVPVPPLIPWLIISFSCGIFYLYQPGHILGRDLPVLYKSILISYCWLYDPIVSSTYPQYISTKWLVPSPFCSLNHDNSKISQLNHWWWLIKPVLRS